MINNYSDGDNNEGGSLANLTKMLMGNSKKIGAFMECVEGRTERLRMSHPPQDEEILSGNYNCDFAFLTPLIDVFHHRFLLKEGTFGARIWPYFPVVYIHP